MGVRCDIEDHHMPQIWCSSGGEKFMKDVLQRDPSRLAIQLESYMISGLAGSGACTAGEWKCTTDSGCIYSSKARASHTR